MKIFPSELRIGGLTVSPPLVMAPMAGVTNTSFRRLLAELGGPGLFYSEMLSARALRHEAPGESIFLSNERFDRPLCVQIFASSSDQIPPAVRQGNKWNPDMWDLNCGCPAPEIVKQGAGSALMRDPERARDMAVTMRECVAGPLLFKMRADEDHQRFLDFAVMLQEAGADCIVLHGRTPGQKFGRPARWEYIARAVERLRVPVIGNGDVGTVTDAFRMAERTGCAGVMIGRGAIERPWVFREIAQELGRALPPLEFSRKSQVFHRMAELLRKDFPHPRNIYRLREFTLYFRRNYKFGHQLWKGVHNSPDLDIAEERAAAFFERNRDDDELTFEVG